MSIALQTQVARPLELKPYKSLPNNELQARIQAVRERLGSRLLILGHHYQQDEVIALADLRGDSYQLSRLAAADSRDCRAIALLRRPFYGRDGRHPGQSARADRPSAQESAFRGGSLPDMAAGCSMADMACDRAGRVNCWKRNWAKVIDTEGRYARNLREFRGQSEGFLRSARRDRLHVEATPQAVLNWAFAPQMPRAFSFPDQHLGAKYGAGLWGSPWTRCRSGTRIRRHAGGNTAAQCLLIARVRAVAGALQRASRCFAPSTSTRFLAKYPGIRIPVHPDVCARKWSSGSDISGSTGKIIVRGGVRPGRHESGPSAPSCTW